jgi:hypothetical protein
VVQGRSLGLELIEWGTAGDHLDDGGTKRPNVGLWTGSLLPNGLRGHEVGSPFERRKPTNFEAALYLLGGAEIAEFDNSRSVDENIPTLDIAVNDSVLVEVVQAEQDLLGVDARHPLGQRSEAANNGRNRPSRDKFHVNVQRVVPNLRAKIGNDIGVAQVLHDVDLGLQLPQLFRGGALGRNLLHSEKTPVVHVEAEKDGAVCTAADTVTLNPAGGCQDAGGGDERLSGEANLGGIGSEDVKRVLLVVQHGGGRQRLQRLRGLRALVLVEGAGSEHWEAGARIARGLQLPTSTPASAVARLTRKDMSHPVGSENGERRRNVNESSGLKN